MKRRDFLKNTSAAGMFTLITPSGLLYSFKEQPNSDLNESFQTPPASARPFTWWHWMNGNVTKEGITLDLEAMAAVGIGGFQTFSASSGIPPGDAEYLTPLWIELMQHAGNEALRLGLEFDMHNCMGWSSSGGSWITPELSMQQIVWSEAYVKGGEVIKQKLIQPFTRLNYYRDTHVVAFPSIKGERGYSVTKPSQITSNGHVINAHEIGGLDLSKGIQIVSGDPLAPSYLVYEFDRPVEIRSASLNATDVGVPDKKLGDTIILEFSNDGVTYSKVAELSKLRKNPEIPAIAHFSVITAKYFRFSIPMALKLLNVSLSASESIDDWLFKAGYPFLGKFNPKLEIATETLSKAISEGAINPDDVIDISQYMNADGELNWKAPNGYWTIIRFGHTTTGSTNRPADGKGLGLECDKYSKEAFDFHFNYMLENLLPVLAPLATNGKFGMVIDSYEVDNQNWTKAMPAEFAKRRGYDIVQYMPVLTGRVVANANQTERFLWDFRQTCADLIADNYQDRFVELCKKHNILSYTEPYNTSPFEQMRAGAKMDINLGEFWLKAPHFSHSIKLAASVQNMNGRQIVAAESFTGRPCYSKWQEYPYSMKTQGDFMLTLGVNRFIFHRYAHQPHPSALPGMTMGPWGFHFERTNTWFYLGRQWIDYITRCQYMLQQGVFVGDVMCFVGEEAPGDDISMGDLRPYLPNGFDFQFANNDIVLNQINIKAGKIVLADGLSFSMLLLPDKKFMTLAIARKLKDLVKQGMILVGPKPKFTPGLLESTSVQQEFETVVNEIWGNERLPSGGITVGKGKVFAGKTVKEVIQSLGLTPDFIFTSKSGDAPINYIHRKTKKGHIYFVANRRRFVEEIVCDFRVSGFQPELWDADSGKITPLTSYQIVGDITRIPIKLDPGGAVFVVFEKTAPKMQITDVLANGKQLLSTHHFYQNTVDVEKQIINNFTLSLWVKPETDELIPSKPGPFPETTRYLSNYPIYAPAGSNLFGEGHATFCLLIARNGVAVFEKAGEDFEAVLVADIPISGWTHFAVTYNQGLPSLYINGNFVKQGAITGKAVHLLTGKYYANEKLFYYDGDISKPAVFDAPLSESKIKNLFLDGKFIETEMLNIEPAVGRGAGWLYWENGHYEFKTSNGQSITTTISDIDSPMVLSGSWQVQFPEGRGAPRQIQLTQLSSLHLHSNSGVKYFSGTAVYLKVFSLNASMLANGKRIYLDLGRVAVIAEVYLNGKKLGIIWKPPFRVDITENARAGDNSLEVHVTNLWPNRLIGDEHLPVENEYKNFEFTGAGIVKLPEWYKKGKPKPGGGRITFATWRHFTKESPLLESGLIGPVRIRNGVMKYMTI